MAEPAGGAPTSASAAANGTALAPQVQVGPNGWPAIDSTVLTNDTLPVILRHLARFPERAVILNTFFLSAPAAGVLGRLHVQRCMAGAACTQLGLAAVWRVDRCVP